MKIKSQEDFWAGVMFVCFGVLAIVVARDYPMGSALRMGPGYFPTYLGAIIIVIGAIMMGRAYRVEGEKIGRVGWRPLMWLSVAFAAFGLLIDEAGFVLALLALIVASSLAGRDTRLVELIFLTVGLITGSIALFVYGLELPYQLFPWR
ncbi:MAG: tripartite tricarboxylate transporter TctB family protein [Rhodanobacter sp.]